MDDEPPYSISIICLTDRSGPHPDLPQEPCGEVFDQDRLIGAITAVLHRHRQDQACISVAIVDDERMAEINQTYLAHSGTTDVISFDLRDADVPCVDGELILSLDTAGREAQLRNHSVEAELMLYAVHGTLHLLGYLDRDPADAKKMHAVEDEILAEMGMGRVYVDSSPAL